MIRVEAVWLCTEPMAVRAGTDITLARVGEGLRRPAAPSRVRIR